MAELLRQTSRFSRRFVSLNSNIFTFSKAISYSGNANFSLRQGFRLGHKPFGKLRVPESFRRFHSRGSYGEFSWIRSGRGVFYIAGGAIVSCSLYKIAGTWNASLSSETTTAYCKESEAYNIDIAEGFKDQIEITQTPERKELRLKLYQYQTCPFCCKVRAFLDYYGIQYEKIEVNPLMRKEIKFSDYRKVPIAMVDDVQLNDSSLIISILRSHMLGKGSLEQLLVYYPKMETGEGKKKKMEYANRHNVMYMQAMPTKEQQQAVGEEAKWRKWVDSTFVHTLSPNIYRTLAESFQAFEYFSEVGNFSAFERFFAKNCGAVFMFIISKNLKKRYNLKDNVRQSLYDEANKWMKAVGKKRQFMGGGSPNLADLSVYGVLSGIEGLDAFNDLMINTDIKPWYERVKKTVKSHQGQKEYGELMHRQKDEF